MRATKRMKKMKGRRKKIARRKKKESKVIDNYDICFVVQLDIMLPS